MTPNLITHQEQAIIDSWFRSILTFDSVTEYPQRIVMAWVEKLPHEKCWELILEMVLRAPQYHLLNFVGYLPLQKFLELHGESYVDLVLTQAKNDPKFAEAFLTVRKRGISNAVFAKIKTCQISLGGTISPEVERVIETIEAITVFLENLCSKLSWFDPSRFFTPNSRVFQPSMRWLNQSSNQRTKLNYAEKKLNITFPEKHKKALFDPNDPIHSSCEFLTANYEKDISNIVKVNAFLHLGENCWESWPDFLVAFASNWCSDYYAYDLRSQSIVYIDPNRSVLDNLQDASKLPFRSFEEWYHHCVTARSS